MRFLPERLEGYYPVGPIQADGTPEFGWRQFDDETSPIQREAAAEIRRLRKLNWAYWMAIDFIDTHDPGLVLEALEKWGIDEVSGELKE